MKKIFVLVFSFFLVGCFNQATETPRKNPEMDQSESNQPAAELQPLQIGNQSFFIEVATTPAERQQGLMNRESLPANQGMLFVFEDEAPRNFWMKNTLIPLDMIWINEAKTIVDIKAAEPCKIADCPTYLGAAPAKYVLELNQGVLRAQVGAVVQF